jgi:hypothetical protein
MLIIHRVIPRLSTNVQRDCPQKVGRQWPFSVALRRRRAVAAVVVRDNDRWAPVIPKDPLDHPYSQLPTGRPDYGTAAQAETVYTLLALLWTSVIWTSRYCGHARQDLVSRNADYYGLRYYGFPGFVDKIFSNRGTISRCIMDICIYIHTFTTHVCTSIHIHTYVLTYMYSMQA